MVKKLTKLDKLKLEIEELADYLYVNINDEDLYKVVVRFGRIRFQEGQLSLFKDKVDNLGGNASSSGLLID